MEHPKSSVVICQMNKIIFLIMLLYIKKGDVIIMNNETLIFLIVVIAVSMYGLIFCIYNINTKRLDLKTLEFYDHIDFDAKHSLLQKIIDDEMDQYKVLNIEYQDAEEIYLNSEMIKDMTNYVTAAVFIRITPAIKANLSLIFDVSDDEKLMIVIGTRVSLEVLQYSIEKNKVIE
jgi:hypothetical protein